MDAATLAAQGIVNAALSRHRFDDVRDDGEMMAYEDGGEEDDLLPTQSDVGVRTRRRRSTIEWDLIGTYQTEEEMMAERMKEKVSKRITDHLRVGRKVKYRCNKWKTTRCTFQMYALYALDGSISLYKTGQHNHDNSNIRRRGPNIGIGRPPLPLAPPSSYGKSDSSGAPTMVKMRHQYSTTPITSTHYGGTFGRALDDQLANDGMNDSFEANEDGNEADSSLLTQRFNWLLVGVYGTEQEMLSELVKERVSKRAANNLVMGRKVTYRCSQYRNTGCMFQMYVLYRRDGYIALYKANQHNHVLSTSSLPEDHLISDSLYGDVASSSMSSQPSSLQSSLSLLVQQALAQGSAEGSLHHSPPVKKQDESRSSDVGRPPALRRETSGTYSIMKRADLKTSAPMSRSSLSSMRWSGARSNPNGVKMEEAAAFSLADGQSIAHLLQLASDMDLKFTFNARRGGEYCFEASSSSSSSSSLTKEEEKGVLRSADGKNERLVVLADMGEEVRVSVRIGPEEIDVEVWTKSDWAQFVWAVRGKCHKALKSSTSA
uniref:Uncharacterized protein n=1 Tax=Plectus sambesii TaxID=2011161 RepID=A0A914XH77_9BILA